jgi:hypothetical protein
MGENDYLSVREVMERVYEKLERDYGGKRMDFFGPVFQAIGGDSHPAMGYGPDEIVYRDALLFQREGGFEVVSLGRRKSIAKLRTKYNSILKHFSIASDGKSAEELTREIMVEDFTTEGQKELLVIREVGSLSPSGNYPMEGAVRKLLDKLQISEHSKLRSVESGWEQIVYEPEFVDSLSELIHRVIGGDLIIDEPPYDISDALTPEEVASLMGWREPSPLTKQLIKSTSNVP